MISKFLPITCGFVSRQVKFIILFLFTLSTFDAFSKTGPEQNSCNAIDLGCTPIFYTKDPYSGSVKFYGHNPCFKSVASNGTYYNHVFFSFTAQNNGSLRFLITPNKSYSDYDYYIFDVTNWANCDLKNNTTDVGLRCNPNSIPGTTGLISNPGCSGMPGNCRYDAPQAVVVGRKYLILVSYYNDGYVADDINNSGEGFTFDATTSDPGIFGGINFTPTASPASIYPGCSTTLTAGISTDGNTYTWNGGSLINSVGNTKNVTPSINTTYTVIGSRTGCVPVTKSVSVAVNPTPNLSIVPSVSRICKGGTLSLTVSGGPSSGVQYNWTGAGLVSTTGTTVNAKVNGVTTYTVTAVQAGTSCTIGSKSITITPDLPYTFTLASNKNSICPGSNAILSVVNPVTGIVYTWHANGATISTGSSITVSPATSTVYTVLASNTGSVCSNPSATLSLTVNPRPVLTLSGDNDICASGNLCASISPLSAAGTFAWSSSVLNSYTLSSSSCVAPTACTAPAWNATTIYTASSSPVTYNGRLYQALWWTQNNRPDLFTWHCGGCDAGLNMWKDLGACSSSNLSSQINITKPANYSVTYTDINGCVATASQNVTMSNSKDILWATYYGNAELEEGVSIDFQSDNSPIIAGVATYGNPGIFIAKLSSDGNSVIWRKDFKGYTIGTNYTDIKVDKSDNSIYLWTALYYGTVGAYPESTIFKFDNNGNLLWSKVVTTPAVTSLSISVDITNDGVYLAGYDFSDRGFCARIDKATGNTVWRKYIGVNVFSAGQVTHDEFGNIYFISNSQTGYYTAHGEIYKIDPNGNIVNSVDLTYPNAANAIVYDAGKIYILSKIHNDANSSHRIYRLNSTTLVTENFTTLNGIYNGSLVDGFKLEKKPNGNLFIAFLNYNDNVYSGNIAYPYSGTYPEFQPFLLEVDPNSLNPVWGTYWKASGGAGAIDLGIDQNNDIYVTGNISSYNNIFQVHPNSNGFVLQNSLNGYGDAVIMKFGCSSSSSSARMSFASSEEVNDLKVESQISAFPNPFTGSITIGVNGEGEELYDLEVISADGKVELTMKNLSVNEPIMIGESLQPGLYFVKVSNQNMTKMIKVNKL